MVSSLWLSSYYYHPHFSVSDSRFKVPFHTKTPLFTHFQRWGGVRWGCSVYVLTPAALDCNLPLGFSWYGFQARIQVDASSFSTQICHSPVQFHLCFCASVPTGSRPGFPLFILPFEMFIISSEIWESICLHWLLVTEGYVGQPDGKYWEELQRLPCPLSTHSANIHI